MKRSRVLVATLQSLAALLLASTLTGCWIAPQGRLTFPASPTRVEGNATWYDVNRNGRTDFATIARDDGLVDAVGYDDDENGSIDRIYRLSEYADRDVPHVILLLDSIPYRTIAKRYDAGDFRFLPPPVKVIAPFPSVTEVCFTDVLHAPMLPGLHDEYFDQRVEHQNRGLKHRLNGYTMPWEARLHYTQRFYENGLSFLRPRPWFHGELARMRTAIDKSPDRVTLAYIGSASAMVCKFGEGGCDEVLDGAQRLCLQLLYERRGAVKFTMLADHGHNYIPSKNLDIGKLLESSGFRVAKNLKNPKDVVVELNGLVTYAGLYTMRPRAVSKALLKGDEMEFVMHLEGEGVKLQRNGGSAMIESRQGKVRYRALDGDPLAYLPVVAAMRDARQIDADGFASDADWLSATIDHAYPDAPRRIWDVFHRIAINTPSVIATLKPGYCAGLSSFDRVFDMASSHGSLSQDDSATFVMTMTKRQPRPMRSRDVLPAIEPDAIRPIVNLRPENKP
jgi:hypothetical protein